jgi:hypothetical protein
VLLRARQVDVGTVRVTAQGNSASALGLMNTSSVGYVALRYVTSFSGVTFPTAVAVQITAP